MMCKLLGQLGWPAGYIPGHVTSGSNITPISYKFTDKTGQINIHEK
jgi:hypothetical protein